MTVLAQSMAAGRVFLRRLVNSEMLRHATISFGDQTVLSATNFAIGVLLIRNVPQAEYGAFVLANSAIFLAIGLQNALITTPMSVLAPKREGQEQRSFVGALAATQYSIWLPLVALLFCVAFLGRYLGLDITAQRLTLAVACALPFVFLREFLRRTLFVYMNPAAVLVMDILYALSVLALISFVVHFGSRAAVLTILSLGVAGIVSCIAGFTLSRRLGGWAFSRDFSALAETWRHGRWSLMGVTVTWLHNQGFLYMLNMMRSTVEVANVSATRLLLMPVVVLLMALESIVKPRGAHLLHTGQTDKLKKVLMTFAGSTGLSTLLYTAVLYLLHSFVSDRVFHKQIDGLPLLISLWGTVFLFQSMRRSLSTYLQIKERFKTLFKVGATAAFISLTVGYFGILYYDAPGSLLGLAAGEFSFILGLSFISRYSAQRCTDEYSTHDS